jgi:hypothetical protein
LPVAPTSAALISAIGGANPVRLDAGGLEFGIPINVVPDNEPSASINFDYPELSDPGPYPIPLSAEIEGGTDVEGDRRVVVVQRDTCRLYELFYARVQGAA